MNKYLAAAIVLVGLVFHAEATPMCVNGATYDTYKGTTCMVGPLTFSGFGSSFNNAMDLGGNMINDMSVTVNVIMNAATGMYGLMFSFPGGGGMAVRPPAQASATISYELMGPALIMETLAMTGARMGDGASATVGESGGNLSTSAPNPLTDSTTLGGITMLSVVNTASINTPAGSMQAQVQSFTNTFTIATPEPGSLLLLSCGLVAIGASRHGRKHPDSRDAL